GGGDVAVGDLNGDGKPDVAVAFSNEARVGVFLGTGTGTFAETDYPAGSNVDGVAIADLDGDGRPDIASSEGSGGSVIVRYGTGAGTLGDQVPLDTAGG